MQVITIPEFTGHDASTDLSVVVLGFTDTLTFLVQLEQTTFTNDLATLTLKASISSDPSTFQILEVDKVDAVLVLPSTDPASTIDYRDPFNYDRLEIIYTANGNTGTINKIKISKKEVPD